MIDRTRISEPATIFESEAMVDEIKQLRKEVDRLKEQVVGERSMKTTERLVRSPNENGYWGPWCSS